MRARAANGTRRDRPSPTPASASRPRIRRRSSRSSARWGQRRRASARARGSGWRSRGSSSSSTAAGSGSKSQVGQRLDVHVHASRRAPMAGELILLVEDNDNNRMLVRDVLQASGYRVVEAENAEDGLRMAAEQRPALILMDIQLPGMNGIEALQRLRADPATRAIPVIAVTASAMTQDRQPDHGRGVRRLPGEADQREGASSRPCGRHCRPSDSGTHAGLRRRPATALSSTSRPPRPSASRSRRRCWRGRIRSSNDGPPPLPADLAGRCPRRAARR